MSPARTCAHWLAIRLWELFLSVKIYGEAGIRTLGTLLGYNALAKRRFRPLSHLTKHELGEYSDRDRTSN